MASDIDDDTNVPEGQQLMRTTLERVLGFPSDHPAVKIIERAGLLDLPSLLSFPLDNFDSLKDSSRAKIIDGSTEANKQLKSVGIAIYDLGS